LPKHAIEALQYSLKGKNLVSADDAFEIIENGSPTQGHIETVLTAMKKLNFSKLIASRPSRERDIFTGMVAARILEPQSKLATTR